MISEGNGRELVVAGVDGSAEPVRVLGWAGWYAAGAFCPVVVVRGSDGG